MGKWFPTRSPSTRRSSWQSAIQPTKRRAWSTARSARSREREVASELRGSVVPGREAAREGGGDAPAARAGGRFGAGGRDPGPALRAGQGGGGRAFPRSPRGGGRGRCERLTSCAP